MPPTISVPPFIEMPARAPACPSTNTVPPRMRRAGRVAGVAVHRDAAGHQVLRQPPPAVPAITTSGPSRMPGAVPADLPVEPRPGTGASRPPPARAGRPGWSGRSPAPLGGGPALMDWLISRSLCRSNRSRSSAKPPAHSPAPELDAASGSRVAGTRRGWRSPRWRCTHHSSSSATTIGFSRSGRGPARSRRRSRDQVAEGAVEVARWSLQGVLQRLTGVLLVWR